MEKRKEDENLEAIIKKKTAIGTAIVATLFFALFIFIVVVFLTRDIIGLTAIGILLVTGLLLCGLTFLLYKCLKSAYKIQETYNANEKTVMNKLSKDQYTKVIPKYRTKFLDDLQNKRNVEFYAKLIELRKQEAVQVYVKYITESEYIKYDAYLPGYFLDYYEIVEN